jgi:hypothetical protein
VIFYAEYSNVCALWVQNAVLTQDLLSTHCNVLHGIACSRPVIIYVVMVLKSLDNKHKTRLEKQNIVHHHTTICLCYDKSAPHVTVAKILMESSPFLHVQHWQGWHLYWPPHTTMVFPTSYIFELSVPPHRTSSVSNSPLTSQHTCSVLPCFWYKIIWFTFCFITNAVSVSALLPTAQYKTHWFFTVLSL